MENVTAFLGLHDISNPHSSGKFRRYPVSQIIPAPHKQDIALIKVDGEIDIRYIICPPYLPVTKKCDTKTENGAGYQMPNDEINMK